MKTVLVDVGNVLVWVHPRRMVAALAARAGCPTELAEHALYGERRKWALDRGELSFDGYRTAVEAVVGAPCCDPGWFRTAWRGIFDDRPEAPLLIATLRAAGCRLAIASNTDPCHWEWLRTRPAVASIVEGPGGDACLSFELGALKPEPAFYERALARLGASPGDCLLVDDRVDNVEGAFAAGLMAVQYPMDDARELIELALPALMGGGGPATS